MPVSAWISNDKFGLRLLCTPLKIYSHNSRLTRLEAIVYSFILQRSLLMQAQERDMCYIIPIHMFRVGEIFTADG